MRLHEDLIPRELRAYFRDIQDHVSRLLVFIDGMRDMLTTAMQVNLALVANNQNEVVKRLAGWGAILAIPTVDFSLYGMNFTWMPNVCISRALRTCRSSLEQQASSPASPWPPDEPHW